MAELDIKKVLSERIMRSKKISYRIAYGNKVCKNNKYLAIRMIEDDDSVVDVNVLDVLLTECEVSFDNYRFNCSHDLLKKLFRPKMRNEDAVTVFNNYIAEIRRYK